MLSDDLVHALDAPKVAGALLRTDHQVVILVPLYQLLSTRTAQWFYCGSCEINPRLPPSRPPHRSTNHIGFSEEDSWRWPPGDLDAQPGSEPLGWGAGSGNSLGGRRLRAGIRLGLTAPGGRLWRP